MVFVGNPSTPRKSKQHFKIWLVFEWFSQEIQVGFANRSKLFNFDPFLNGFFPEILPARPRKSKQPFKFWPVSEWLLQETHPGLANRSKLFNFDQVLKSFCRNSYQTTQIEATFQILTRFLVVFARNPTRPRKSKQTFQLWPVFGWMVLERNPTRPRKWKQQFQFWPVFEWMVFEGNLLDH